MPGSVSAAEAKLHSAFQGAPSYLRQKAPKPVALGVVRGETLRCSPSSHFLLRVFALGKRQILSSIEDAIWGHSGYVAGDSQCPQYRAYHRKIMVSSLVFDGIKIFLYL